jgi:HlyD family secretion protein
MNESKNEPMKRSKLEKVVIDTPPVIDDLIVDTVKAPEKKPFLSKRMRWIIGGALLIVVIIILIISSNARKAAAAQTFQTEPLKIGELVAVTGATGTVRANQSATLYWQTTGRIESIKFAVGDKVATGEVMANLAQSSLSQSITAATAQLFNAQQALIKVKDSSAERAAAELSLAQAQSAYNTALGNFWNSNGTQGSEDMITVTQAKLQLADNKIYDLQKKYDAMAELQDNDTKKATTLRDLTQAKIDRETIKKQLDYFKANPDSLDVQTLQAKLDVAKANLEDAQREYARLKDGPDPDEVASAQAQVEGLKATAGMANLTAPFTGTVTQLNGMVGDLVSVGTITYRVDDLNKLMVDIQISEVDINTIKVGQNATLTFDAIPNKEYSGKVTQVARVGDVLNGVVEFKVTLQVLNPDTQVLPGMTAAVNITVQNKQDVLLIPNRAIRLVNGQYVVYVDQNGSQQMVPIVIGSTNDSYSELVSGDLKAGDLVILNPSSSFIDMMQSQGQSRRSPMGG